MITLRPTPMVLAAALVLGASLPSTRAEKPAPAATPAFWLEKAEALTRRMPHPEARAALLVSIGTGWVEAGELARARPLLASAARYGSRCRGCITKARRLAEVALLQHRAGDEVGAAATFQVAREAVNELDGAARIQARVYLAVQWHAAGDADTARGLLAKSAQAAGTLEGLEQAEALAAIADADAELGNVAQAARARERLAQAVSEIGPEAAPILESTLLTAAAARIAAGDRPAALTLLATVAQPELAVSGWVSLVRVCFESNDREGAALGLARVLEAVPRIEDPGARAQAWADVARVAGDLADGAVEARALEEIERALGEIEGGGARLAAEILRLDALRAARREDRLREGLLALEGAVDAGADEPVAARDGRRAGLAGLEARAGRFEQAARMAAGIADPVHRARARLDVADEHRKAGQVAPALAAVAAVLGEVAAWGADLEGDASEVMRRAAVLQAACGKPAEALKTVDAIRSPFHAATACTYIARDLT